MSTIDVYAAYSVNTAERLSSASGGVFSLLGKTIIASGGVVYGVAMSDDCKCAEYIRVTSEDSLSKLKSSKYLQAHVGDTFKSVKADLTEGRTVLFSGTGCTVNGLAHFLCSEKCERLAEKYPGLYCTDIICHGVPSPALWRKYAEYLEAQNSGRLLSVNFRCKMDDTNGSSVREVDEGQKEIFISKDTDPYMQMFLRDYCLRPSCYECNARQQRSADITLGDFWGIGNAAPQMAGSKGTSLILVRSNRGAKLLSAVSEQMVIKAVGYKEAVAANPSEYRSPARPSQRGAFFGDMRSMEFEELSKKYSVSKQITTGVKAKKIIRSVLVKSKIVRTSANDYYLGFLLKMK